MLFLTSLTQPAGILWCRDEHLHRARLKLAAEGFSNDKTVGFELLDKEQSLGTSQFMENARYRRGLEGELARTINSMIAVRKARVHLALPKQSVFVRDQRKPTASVFLELIAGRRLEAVQVQAIANLVASSIPELASEDVTVVDQKGRLLNTRDMDTDVVMAANSLSTPVKLKRPWLIGLTVFCSRYWGLVITGLKYPLI